ncbi:hypothetical protein AR540_02690 [Pseudomonas sp. EpS/L25]|nr:hypothetical protein AR540_02690 [Pseudomonas sp. EpS/L25]
MSTVGTVGWVDNSLGRLAIQTFPQLQQLVVQFGIADFAKPFPGDEDQIETAEAVLIQTEGISDDPLDAIALDGKLDAFLADDQPQAGMVEPIGMGEQQQVLAGCLVGGRVKDRLELLGAQ